MPALTAAMARGEERAFRDFYDAYFNRLLRYLLVVTQGNEPAAREALQAALVRVARYVKPFPGEEPFWRWLTVLARSAWVDETRKERRWFAFLERFSRQTGADTGSTAGDGQPDEKLHELLAQMLATLPQDERDLITQKYFTRLSVREIAAAQQTTEKAVESKLGRVRGKLRTAILGRLRT